MTMMTKLFFLVLIQVVRALKPRPAPADTPWEDLEAILGPGADMTTPSVQGWRDQCIQPFRDAAGSPIPLVSNYQLLNQSEGTCLAHLSCVLPNCFFPGQPPLPANTNPAVFASDDDELFQLALSVDVDLPARVLNPRYASDVVNGVRFAAQHGVGITAKVAGHSYVGASSADGTLLIKMSTRYPKYGIDGGGVFLCSTLNETDTTSAYAMACSVALSRNKPAVMRVGGGELFDEAYRAVFIEWNAANPDNMLHLVAGGAGTVSAAGGWVASGGLSGTTGMRMYGLGLDQVTHIEMVLPNGEHVRFGPTEWQPKDGEGYPTTTTVTGYCNANPLDPDEQNWEWITCDKNINFTDLWFAVRGGGGGTWGIVTSLYYQLHEYPGRLQQIGINPTAWEGFVEQVTSPDQAAAVVAIYLKFLLQFLYTPETLDVTEDTSRRCNSPGGSFSPFSGPLFWCYGTSGAEMLSAWNAYLVELDPASLQDLPDGTLERLNNTLAFVAEVDSYPAEIINYDEGTPCSVGRAKDDPPATVVPIPASITLTDVQATHFPLDAVINKMDDIVGVMSYEMISDEIFGKRGYMMGGFIPAADDGLNSLSPNRRTAAFWKATPDHAFRDQYYQIFYGNEDGSPVTGDVFPGSACHNHALIFEMGPLKDDWTVACPLEWPQEERDEKCISQPEAFWGTTNWKRLEDIKTVVDPDGIFVANGGIGYTYGDGTEAPTESPTSAGITVGLSAIAIFVALAVVWL